MRTRESTVEVSVSLPVSLKAELDIAAQADDRSRSNLTAIAIREMLERRRARAAAERQEGGTAP